MGNNITIFLALGIVFLATIAPTIIANTENSLASSIHLSVNKPTTFQSMTQNDADVPIWNTGDSWTYNIDLKGSYASNVNFDISIKNFVMEVRDVGEENYIVDYHVSKGDVYGTIFVDLDFLQLEGSLINTKISGWLRIGKSDLNIVNGVIDVDGFVDKSIDIPITAHVWVAYCYRTENGTYNETDFYNLHFPLNVGQTWSNPLTYLGFNVEQFNLAPPFSRALNLSEPSFQCMQWTVVDVNNDEYDALEIVCEGSQNRYWFAPGAGAIVKVTYSDFDFGEDGILDTFTMNLLSTTYQAPTTSPNPPGPPSGPTVLDVGNTVAYEVSTTDPDGDLVRYIVDWGTGSQTTTELYPSGQKVHISQTWMRKGVYTVKVLAQDKYGVESPWSNSLTVTVNNRAPAKPANPSGPIEGTVGISYAYVTSSVDPDGHAIQYGWDWDGDSITDDWSHLHPSGESCSTSHTWTQKGDFNVKVRAMDEYGEESEWSESITVTQQNTAPQQPSQPSGPASGRAGNKYTYATSCIDPDAHKVKYGWDWDGDNIVDDWSNLFPSGVTCSMSNIWSQRGQYTIKVKAMDEYGEESEWSDPLEVSMPKDRDMFPFLANHLEQYPLLDYLLK